MKREDFERLVLQALKDLPKEYADKLENVGVVIEDLPDMETAKKLGLRTRGRLLGLYQGIPLKDRTHYYGMVMPDKITLYQANIELACKIKGLDIHEEVRHVLQHEIAHHFGITDERLTDLDIY